MTKFEAKKFDIPNLKGISEKTIEEHLKLYEGYVKNANLILEKMPQYRSYEKEDVFAPYVVGELARRFSFEYNGMRNHETYFASLEGGLVAPNPNSFLYKAIEEEWGSFDVWLLEFKTLATTTRGIGWMVLWYDKKNKKLLMSWMDEQHLGLLNDCAMILALDMWEHSYVADYQPSGKKNYVEDFFSNLNWSVIEENFQKAQA